MNSNKSNSVRFPGRIAGRLVLLAMITGAVFAFTACGEPELKVNYTIDGKKTEELPSRGLYEIVSIKCNNKNAAATWDNNTWKLTTSELTRNTTVDLDFTYTSHPFTVNGRGFDDLQSAFNAAGDGAHAEIHLTKDATGSAVTPVGSDITLTLNGFTLESDGSDTIVNNGTLNIIGEGTIANTVGNTEQSKSLVNYGTLSASNVIFTNSTPSFTLWNSNNGQSTMNLDGCTLERSEAEIITLVNSGTLNLSGCTVSGGGDLTHPTVLQNDGSASITVSASAIRNTGSGYSLYRESGSVTVDGGSDCPNSYGVE